jgi:fibronectin type 3 domain-containing protein
MVKDDGVKHIQGLRALAERFGPKPYEQLQAPGHTWQTERVIFRDVDTGAPMVRLTNDPWMDGLSYFGKNWSADGQWVVFRRQPGLWEPSTETHGPMAMRADGTGLRNVFRDYKVVRSEACSPGDPNICFAMADSKTVATFDLRTGKLHHVVGEQPGSWHMKISPDGQYILGRGPLKKGGRGIWVLSADGKEHHEASVPEDIHDSYQFHPKQKKLMFWYEGHYLDGFIQCDFDGKVKERTGVAFDWNHGDIGPDRGVHNTGDMYRFSGDKWTPREFLFHAPGVEYFDDPCHYNGYVSWSPKDQLWAYCTRLLRLPYLSEIQAFHTEPVPGDVVNRYRICYTASNSPACLDHPGASPDGTKVLFNTDMFDNVDAYYVVARMPETPRDLRAEPSGDQVRLHWQPPAHHAEIAGYHVYRSSESGASYTPITPRPVRETELTVPAGAAGRPVFYAVTAVEHSGLESGLSGEAVVGDAGGAPRRVFVEAEQGERDRLMWIALEGSASNLHYVWMRSQKGEGRVTFSLSLPEGNKPWRVWARVKGEKGVHFQASCGGRPLTLKARPTTTWTWLPFDGALDSPSGHPLVLTSPLCGSAIDCLMLATDTSFKPTETPRVRWPALGPVENVRARAESPYAVRLSWPAVAADTLHHYSLYCGRTEDFRADQGTLVASPDRSAFVDWGLRPGTTYYYRIRCVDRAGNESSASVAVAVSTPAVEKVVLDRPPAREVVFDLPRTGPYALWLELERGRGEGQYINIHIDGKKVTTWTIQLDGLGDTAWFNYDKWGRFLLDAGRHTFTLANETAHVVRKIRLVSDLSYKPEGHYNWLNGW